jgi:hypothetical protein
MVWRIRLKARTVEEYNREKKGNEVHFKPSVLVQWDLPGTTCQIGPLTAILLAWILGSRVLFQSGERLGRRVSHDVLPEVMSQTRTTRSSSGNQISFRPAKCKTATYQRSFFIRASRSWNSLPTTLRSPDILGNSKLFHSTNLLPDSPERMLQRRRSEDMEDYMSEV